MGNKFARGKKAFGFCDVCGQRYKLATLKPLTIDLHVTNIKACTECWNEDQPQLQLGLTPINDPQALRNPRPDVSQEASRDIYWGWDPVGGGESVITNTPNPLAATSSLGSVTVTI